VNHAMGTLKAILGVGVFVVLIVVGIQLIPPYFENYQFEDELNNQALAATYSAKTDEDVRAVVYKKAQELEIPVTPEQIKVHRVGTLGTGTLSIEATYTVRVNLPGYPLDLDFHASTKNKGIY